MFQTDGVAILSELILLYFTGDLGLSISLFLLSCAIEILLELLKLAYRFIDRSLVGELPSLGERDCLWKFELFSIVSTSSSSLCITELDYCSFSFIFSLLVLFNLDLRPCFGDRRFSSSELSDPFVPISS